MYSYCSFLPPGPSQATLIHWSHCGTHFLFPNSVSGDSVVFNSGSLSPLNDWNWCGILRSQIIGTDSDFYEDFDSDFDFDSDLDKDLFDFNVDFDTDWVF